jgi:hypothetical protein
MKSPLDSSRPLLSGIVAMGVAAACGSSQSTSLTSDGGEGGQGSSGSGTSSGASSSGADSATDGGSSFTGDASDAGDASAAYDFSVYQHHKNSTRDGLFIEPTFTKTSVATMHKTTFMGTVSTTVYAQPLYVENGPGGPVFVIVTEENHVTVYGAATGAVVWDRGPSVLGAAPNGANKLGLPTPMHCGNINPLGITGTPFIDFSSGQGVIYFDAMTTPDNNVTAKHLVYGVHLADGSVVANWPVDVSAKVAGFTSSAQNQRGALQLVNGILYVPYGGHAGDCDAYHGWVVGIPVATPQSPTAWHTSASLGGIWGTGSLPTDGTSLFVSTGNTSGVAAPNWGGGEAVIRLALGPTFSGATADYYAPSNWPAMDSTDRDLGGANAVLVDMPGTATPHLIAQGGKDTNLYVLNRDNLGGIGTANGPELLVQSVATNEINAAPAVYTTSQGTYVAFRVRNGTGKTCPNAGTGNVIAVKLTAGSHIAASVAWCSSKVGLGSPIVTTTDGTANAVVWAANDSLWGFDGDTGAVIAGGTNTAMSTSVQTLNAAIAAHGKIAVGVNGALYVFAP